MKKKIIISTRLHYDYENSSWGYYPYHYQPIAALEDIFEKHGILHYITKRTEKEQGPWDRRWDFLDSDYVYIFKFPFKEKRKFLETILACQREADREFKIVVK